MSAGDDTTGAGPHAPPARRPAAEDPPAPAPLDYYYDDGTGYEVYDPAEDDGPEEDTPAPPK